MSQRKLYELSAEDKAELMRVINAARNAPLIMLQHGMPKSPQEAANDAWVALGKRMGFDGMTVHSSSQGEGWFTAIETVTP